MDWSDVASAIGKAAPILANVLTGNVPGAIASAGSLIASAFGTDNTPDAIHAAVAADPEAAVKLAQLEADNRVQLAQISLTATSNELAAETARINAQSADYRAELATGKPYVEYMRPTYGYILAVSILMEIGAICWVLVCDPTQADNVAKLIEAISLPQSVALSVLGVYVKKRSDDKALHLGKTAASGPGLLQSVLGTK